MRCRHSRHIARRRERPTPQTTVRMPCENPWSAQPTDYRANAVRIPGVPNPTDYREKCPTPQTTVRI